MNATNKPPQILAQHFQQIDRAKTEGQGRLILELSRRESNFTGKVESEFHFSNGNLRMIVFRDQFIIRL